jgi:mannose-1-phosphate guanylyltransferase
MKIVIFAGGTGRRLWPISRKQSPKQFEPIVGEKSTIQLAVEKLSGTYGWKNIFISSNESYLGLLKEQLPHLPETNFIGEPIRRDLAAAVGLSMIHMAHRFGPDESVAIVWGDNYMTEGATFLRLLKTAEGILMQGRVHIVYIGETARFANNNLGWIGLGSELGDVDGQPYFTYASWVYRPELKECERMFASGNYVWNTGYFVTKPGFVLKAYKDYQPVMWTQLEAIGARIGHGDYVEILHQLYPKLDVASFDDAIVQNIPLAEAVVLHGEMGWSDPGTLYALKESVNPDPESNVEKGLVKAHKSKDCLLYNYEEGKLMSVAGLDGMVVVNTEDAIVVVHKDNIRMVKEIVDGLIGTELESFS